MFSGVGVGVLGGVISCRCDLFLSMYLYRHNTLNTSPLFLCWCFGLVYLYIDRVIEETTFTFCVLSLYSIYMLNALPQVFGVHWFLYWC